MKVIICEKQGSKLKFKSKMISNVSKYIIVIHYYKAVRLQEEPKSSIPNK